MNETIDHHDDETSSSLRHHRSKMNRDELWNVRFQQLAEYKQTHAENCILPRNYPPIPELSAWVSNQRRVKRQKKISVEREKKLNAIGFAWFLRSENTQEWTAGTTHTDWNTRFQQLEEYKNANGDCNVSRKNSSEHIDLGRWVAAQRSRQKSARLSEERVGKLNSIGFVWTRQEQIANAHSGRWTFHFQQLLKYRQEFGDCNVPSNFSCNRQLGNWVHNQRWYVKKKTLTKERWSQLNSIGFDWGQQGEIGRAATTTTTTRTTNDPVILLRETRAAELPSEVFETRETCWDTRFRELLACFQAHGDFNVHQYSPRNPLLAGWAREQRNGHYLQGRGEKTSLTPLREAKLDAIGFTWFVDGDVSSSSSSRDAPCGIYS